MVSLYIYLSVLVRSTCGSHIETEKEHIVPDRELSHIKYTRMNNGHVLFILRKLTLLCLGCVCDEKAAASLIDEPVTKRRQ